MFFFISQYTFFLIYHIVTATSQRQIWNSQDTYSEQVLWLWHSSTMGLLHWKLFHDARVEHVPPGRHTFNAETLGKRIHVIHQINRGITWHNKQQKQICLVGQEKPL